MRRSRRRRVCWQLLPLFAALVGFRIIVASDAVAGAAAPVVFVCEHGSVKSLIAASLFGRAAAARGMSVRAVSRGVSPDERVPPGIVAALRDDGFDVAGYKPQPLTASDLTGAARVIAIGVDLSRHAKSARAPIETWNDVPPASVDYAVSKAALERHIGVLLDELQAALAASPPVTAPAREHLAPPGWEDSYHGLHYTPVLKVGDRVIVSGIPAIEGETDEDKIRWMFAQLKLHLEQAAHRFPPQDRADFEGASRSVPRQLPGVDRGRDDGPVLRQRTGGIARGSHHRLRQAVAGGDSDTAAAQPGRRSVESQRARMSMRF
jgi:arsenate reductase (thioredoxin)